MLHVYAFTLLLIALHPFPGPSLRVRDKSQYHPQNVPGPENPQLFLG